MSTEFITEFEREVPTGDAVPIKDAPSRLRLESGVVQATIEELVPGLSSKQSLYQVAATFRVVKPDEYIGALIWDNFVVGTQNDSQAERLETWGEVGGSRFRRMADRAKVPFGKMSAMVGQLVGKSVVLDVYTSVDPPKRKDGSVNPYAGKIRRNIRDFFSVGEKALAAKGVPFDSANAAAASSGVTFDPAATMQCPMCTTVTTAADFPKHAEVHEAGR